MKRFEFPIGKKVKGYGVLNEYGEFDFTPEQTGSRKGVVKVVKEGEGFSVKHTSKCIMVHVSFVKADWLTNVKAWMKLSNQVLQILKEYEV